MFGQKHCQECGAKVRDAELCDDCKAGWLWGSEDVSGPRKDKKKAGGD